MNQIYNCIDLEGECPGHPHFIDEKAEILRSILVICKGPYRNHAPVCTTPSPTGLRTQAGTHSPSAQAHRHVAHMHTACTHVPTHMHTPRLVFNQFHRGWKPLLGLCGDHPAGMLELGRVTGRASAGPRAPRFLYSPLGVGSLGCWVLDSFHPEPARASASAGQDSRPGKTARS